MNFAAPFQIKSYLKGEPDNRISEYNLEYNPKKSQIMGLDEITNATENNSSDNFTFTAMIDFLNEYQDKRVNIKFINGIDVRTAKAFRKISNNVYFRLTPQEITIAKKLSEENIPFFFDSTLGINNYSDLQGIIHTYKLSDVYITDDLCYNLEKVSNYCHKNDISIRLVLNRIPSTSLLRGKIETTPIFRPNDFDLLSKYIDVGEFDCGQPYNFNQEKVLYKAGYIKHDGFGNLQEINQDLKFPIYNRSLVPDFTTPRVQCRMRCVSENSGCNQCAQFIDVANMLSKKNIALKNKV